MEHGKMRILRSWVCRVHGREMMRAVDLLGLTIRSEMRPNLERVSNSWVLKLGGGHEENNIVQKERLLC